MVVESEAEEADHLWAVKKQREEGAGDKMYLPGYAPSYLLTYEALTSYQFHYLPVVHLIMNLLMDSFIAEIRALMIQ